MHDLKSKSTRNVDQYRALYKMSDYYGRSSEELEEMLVTVISEKKEQDQSWQPKTILDFGCGQSGVVEEVGKRIGLIAFKYDPALESFSFLPVEKADFVINTDVLEHLDWEELDDILKDIRVLSSHAIFHIATNRASARLPNGENAHATVMSGRRWKKKISEHFEEVHQLPSKKRRVLFITWRPRRRMVFKLWKMLAIGRIRKKLSR